jgi:uroporphyrinogen-III synthase
MTGVLNTRPSELAPELSARLREAGFEPFEAPLVALALDREGLSKLRALDAGGGLAPFTGVLMSSPNLLSALKAEGEELPKALLQKPWYLISARIRDQVEALGARVAFIPQEASAGGFAREIAPHHGRGARLLHLCSSKTRLRPEPLAAKGIEVENLPLYTPDLPPGAAEAVRAAWPKVDAVVFASGTAVHNLFACAPREAAALGTASGPLAVAIGFSAVEALKSHGVASRVRQAPTADNAGFIAALKKEFS